MVFRPRFRMPSSEEGVCSSRRFKIFILCNIVVAVFVSYYLFSYSRHNKQLLRKHSELMVHLRRYQNEMRKCEKNLQTSQSNAKGFAESNWQLHTSIATKEKEVADLDKTLEETKTKLTQAYAVYNELIKLLGIKENGVSGDDLVSVEVAKEIKLTVTQLVSDRAELQRLDLVHRTLSRNYGELHRNYSSLEERAKTLQENNKQLTKEYIDLRKVVVTLNAKLKKKNRTSSNRLGKPMRVKSRGLTKFKAAGKQTMERSIQVESKGLIAGGAGEVGNSNTLVKEEPLANEIKNITKEQTQNNQSSQEPAPQVKSVTVSNPNPTPKLEEAVANNDEANKIGDDDISFE